MAKIRVHNLSVKKKKIPCCPLTLKSYCLWELLYSWNCICFITVHQYSYFLVYCRVLTWLNPWLLIVLNKKAAVRTIWTVIHFHLLSGHEISQNLYMQVICLPKSPLGFIEEELCGVWSIYSVTFPYGELRHICFPGHVLLCCFTCPSGTDWQTLQTNNFRSLGCQEYLSCIPLAFVIQY